MGDTDMHQQRHRARLIGEISVLTQELGIDPNQIVADWRDGHDGQHIKDATAVGDLELLRDDLTTRKATAQTTQEQQ